MRKTVAAFVLPLLLTACSFSPPISEQTTGPSVRVVERRASATPSTATADRANVERYFELLVTNDPDEQEEAIKLAAPKSPAAAYMTHEAADNGARLDAGNPDDADLLQATEKGYDLCYQVGGGVSQCSHYTSIKTSGGSVSDFEVNGKAIAPRLSLGHGNKVEAGRLGSVEFVSAYKTAVAGMLQVALIVRAGSRPLSLERLYSAEYRDPGGRQATATSATAAAELDPNSTTRVAVSFKTAKPGGVITIELVDAKTQERSSTRVKI